MIKRKLNIYLLFFYFIIINTFFSTKFIAQTYNSWVNTTQTYFKFPITKTGIYQIDSATLATKFNLSSLNPKNIQLFFAGKEQALFINGENDNKINNGDYLQFYLNVQDANLDSLIYANIAYLPNRYQMIFNDTVYAFLTTNSSTSNKRYSIETDTTWASYPTANFVYSNKIFKPVDSYNTANNYPYQASDPRYTQNEGFGLKFEKGITVNTNFGFLNVYTLTPLPSYLSYVFSGYSQENSGQIDHEVETGYVNQLGVNVSLKDTAFFSFKPFFQSYTVTNQNFNDASSLYISSVANPSFSAFSNSCILHYMSFTYPQILDLNGINYNEIISSNGTIGTKQFYDFQNASNTNTIINCYDVTNFKKLPAKLYAVNKIKFIAPNSFSNKKIIIANQDAIIPITQLFNANQNNPYTNFKNSSATNPFVLIYHNITKQAAASYKQYRQSIAGGSYQVIDANIDELYEQFAYGINKHPVAIKNFVKYLIDSLPAKPKYVFLLGKGIKKEDLSAAYQVENFIPTMGIPSSDALLVAGILSGTNTAIPDVPIGRFPAITNTEALDYLEKVQQHEATGLEDWKKRALHFVGGDNTNLTNLIASYMSTYENLFEDTLIGGQVFTYQKNTTAPIQTNISDSIIKTINNGASIINFFGHGSEQGFDQAIDDPSVFNNKNKYPLLISNSCYSGNIYIYGRRSVSERYTYTKEKGSIAFIATSSIGFPYTLHNFTWNFYKSLTSTRYNKGIGDMMQEAITNAIFAGDELTQFTALDMALNGDPSIKISCGALPDYSIKNNNVSLNTSIYPDSIGIFIKHKNLGKALVDSFFVRVTRTFPNNDSAVIIKRIKAPLYFDSLKIFTAIDFNRGVGLNKFKVTLDYFNETNEVTKNNNSTVGTIDLLISGGDIIPVYPYKYAVVPLSNTITLKASTSDPFAPNYNYKFQLDTTDTFLTPISNTVIASSGGVVEWNVNLPYGDSTVYYWRVSKDSVLPSDKFNWRESSFQTITNKSGWGQAHFFQFKNNTYRFTQFKRSLRKFVFENNKHSIQCRNGVPPYLEGVSINWFYNNHTMSSWGCAPNGWNIAVFDSISGIPDDVVSVNWPNSGPGTYSNCVCVSNQVLSVYSFGSSNYCGFGGWQTSLQNFLNTLPNNSYILAYTLLDAQKQSYSNSLFTAFENFGAGNIRNVKDTVPYILFGKKGMSIGQAHEVWGNSQSSVVQLKDSITTKWNSGYILSETIGPSYKWNSLHWRVKALESTPGDTTFLKLIGIKNNGQVDTLQTFPQDSSDVLNLAGYVNANLYPYLRLIAFTKDKINYTSPQLKRWQVLYDEAPECALNPKKGFVALNTKLQEGDTTTFVFPIENIGKKTFNDSLVITYWLEDNQSNKVMQSQKLKRKLFAPGEVILDTVKISSLQLIGNNVFWTYINPAGNSKYQIEQFQFNNIGRYSFSVNKDVTNPLLDVTFDGYRILNGDLVSAKPKILITLKDENKFLALNDTNSFEVSIKLPNQNNFNRLFFSNELQFTPANMPKNSCLINYNPQLLVDGKYSLQVKAVDRSQNRSGYNNYSIDFEINNKPSITNIVNYPNPFNNSTRFVFTLTGSEIPEVFTIQIMTISGKLVKEITRAELGELKIGRNITQYAWDGKDNYGDRLANGVYLYKVITKLNGNALEKSTSGADKYIIKEFGKMVLMR
ncbi:MAG: C25 family cysteine peptidase [Bacteroidetes bacterium]|nr:C25 family cysteine peptidase [Bacteroidota bacterium]